MIISCPKCKTKLNLPDENLKPGETRVKCSDCGAVLVYKGKSPKAPQDNPVEAKPSPSLSPAAVPEASPPPVVPTTERAPMHTGGQLPGQAYHRDIQPPDETAGGRGTDEKQERLKKIAAASEAAKQHSSPIADGKKATPRKAVLAGAAAGILVAVLLAVFFFFSSQDNLKQIPPPQASKGTTSIPASSQESESQGGISGGAPVGPVQTGDSIQQPSSSNTPPASLEEKAIEMVKRSDVLLRSTPVEAIVRKWTDENAARYKIVGWQARKMEEQRYLVSYTALDGNAPKGFYFDVDVQGGVVQDLAKNPELQKKYDIQYNR